MPRCAREISLTGYYHVFDRGNSKHSFLKMIPTAIVSYRTYQTGLRAMTWWCWPGVLWTTTSI